MNKPNNQENTGKVTRERYKLCSKCGNFFHFSEPSKFCIVCGSALILECEKCKEPIIYPTQTFCPACGNKMVQKK